MKECASDVESSREILGMDRRSFCIGTAGAGIMVALGGLKFAGSTSNVRPPGAQDEEKLVASCIRCQKCVEICPRNVIAPSHVESGVLGMRTPRMTFDSDYCDFCALENGDVPLCAQVCPTGAIKQINAPAEDNAILGKAVLSQNLCLAYRLDGGCRYCYDACEYEAMKLDEHDRPVIIVDACNGCGACESVCVSLRNGSILEGATQRAVVIVPEALL